MKHKWRVLLATLTMVVAFGCLYAEPLQNATSGDSATVFTTRTLVKGSVGTDVKELQGRLKLLGFYHGKMDGSFGWGTYWAVRRFQYRFGMHIDGKVGAATRQKLVASTRNYNPATGTAKGASPAARASTQSYHGSAHTTSGGKNVSANDMRMMANAVYGEARGEPYIGQVAIAAVILNRLDNPNFPKSIPSIIFQPGAFTATQDGQIYLTPNQTAERAVHDAMNGYDPSGGAIYYFNPATASSRWIWGRPQIKRIGRHIFCR